MNFANIKGITIPDCVVVKIMSGDDILWERVEEIEPGATNLVPTSIDTDGSVYNGMGYKDSSRLNSSAAVVNLSGYVACGYIAVKASDVVRVKGVQWNSTYNTGCYAWVFDSTFGSLKYKRPSGGSSDITVTVDSSGVITFTFASHLTTVAYFRMSAYGSGANMIVTVNEEIT